MGGPSYIWALLRVVALEIAHGCASSALNRTESTRIGSRVAQDAESLAVIVNLRSAVCDAAQMRQFASSCMKSHDFDALINIREPALLGTPSRAADCIKTAPSRKTAGEEGDRAKAAAAIAGAWAGQTLKCPRATASRPRGAAHGARRERGHPASAKPL